MVLSVDNKFAPVSRFTVKAWYWQVGHTKIRGVIYDSIIMHIRRVKNRNFVFS